jgi:hypothetical protein
MKLVASFLQKLADSSIWQDKIKDKFGIPCYSKEPGGILDPLILRQTYYILDMMPVELVKDAKVSALYFSNSLGPNLPFYPSHGYFSPVNKSITLNNNIFYNPDVQEDFFDERGHFLTRSEHTLYHEFGHAMDDVFGNISQKPEWMSLSGWSFDPKPGLKRLVINESGKAPVIGEMFYDPIIGRGNINFVRFYARRNSWDDMADSFSVYVGGLKDKIPTDKKYYLDKLLKKYYK